MAADLGVNAMTVSKAYQLLKAEGFIETDRRKGSIVCIPEAEYPTQQAAFEEKLEDELELLTAEAKIRGMDKGQFIQFCQQFFEKMEMNIKNIFYHFQKSSSFCPYFLHSSRSKMYFCSISFSL